MSLCYLDFFKGLYSVYWLLYEYWFSFFRKKWKSLNSILPVLLKAGCFGSCSLHIQLQAALQRTTALQFAVIPVGIVTGHIWQVYIAQFFDPGFMIPQDSH